MKLLTTWILWFMMSGKKRTYTFLKDGKIMTQKVFSLGDFES